MRLKIAETKYGIYAYMKSHAVSCTWIAYQTAYLKAHYPVEYMSALLVCRKNDKYEIRKLKKECEQRIEPEMLDVLKQFTGFSTRN